MLDQLFQTLLSSAEAGGLAQACRDRAPVGPTIQACLYDT
jgi:hypothetical protein